MRKRNLVFDPPPLGTRLFMPGLPGHGTIIKDRSPYGNDGTITGATWKFNRLWYLDFDGSDDKVSPVSAKSLFNPMGAFTWLAWVRDDEAAGNTIYSEGVPGEIFPFFKITVSTLHLQITGRNDANTEVIARSTNITVVAGEWNLLGINRDGAGTYRFFKNNTASASTTNTMAGVFTTTKWGIGCTSRITDGDFFDGGIALPRILNVLLTDAQVAGYYQRERSLFGV